MSIIKGLQLEWFKFSRNKLVILCLLALALLLPGIGSVMHSIDIQIPGYNSNEMLQFPEVWRWMAYISNWLVFFLLGFVFVYIISSEYDNKTLRQSIINGLRREELFLHKLSFIVAISLAYTFYYTICCLLYGLFLTEGAYHISENSTHILYVFLVCLGYGSIGMLIAMLLKSTAKSIISFLIYGMFLENVIRHLVHANIVLNKSMHFYPVNVLEDLTPIPLPEMLSETIDGTMRGGGSLSVFLPQGEALIGAVVYILLFTFLSYRLFMKRDL